MSEERDIRYLYDIPRGAILHDPARGRYDHPSEVVLPLGIEYEGRGRGIRKQGIQNELTEVARSQSEWIGESPRQGEYSTLIG